jgi:Domain of unknown function (DUF4337)
MDNYIVTSDVLASQPSINPAATAARITEYKAHIDKWGHDLTEEQEVAEHFENGVEHAERQAARYDLGEALLQIAVVLSSVTLFTRNHTYFMLGLAIGAAGLITAASALFVH